MSYLYNSMEQIFFTLSWEPSTTIYVGDVNPRIRNKTFWHAYEDVPGYMIDPARETWHKTKEAAISGHATTELRRFNNLPRGFVTQLKRRNRAAASNGEYCYVIRKRSVRDIMVPDQ